MKPFLQQGHLEGSCGFYSVLNAVTEITDISHDDILKVFGRFTKKYPKIASEGFVKGLTGIELRGIVGQIVDCIPKSYKVNYSFPFLNIKFNSVEHYAASLRCELDRPNTAAIVGFGQPWHHWTVATHVTPHAIALKDSTLHSRKMISSLALATNDNPYYRPGITAIHTRQTILFEQGF